MLKWKTKDWLTIDLETYWDLRHMQNILRMINRQIEYTPEPELNISWSDSDWAYAADQSIIRAYNEYEAYRDSMIKYRDNLKLIINNKFLWIKNIKLQ